MQSLSSDALPSPDALLAKAGRENFPVALRVLGPTIGRHLMAIYGFARLVDDLGDEVRGDRESWLDLLEGDLDRVFGHAPQAPEHPLMQRLVPSVEACAFPEVPFRRLVAANRQDQRVKRYARFDELVAYCELSANPVGELVLHVFGMATPERVRLSDSICTALQLAEHWQDVAEDLSKGRVYLPQEDLERFQCSEGDLGQPRACARVRALLSFEVERARSWLARGAPLLNTLTGRARFAVSAYFAGGQAALDAIERADYDVLSRTPRPRRRDFLRRFLRAQARRARSEPQASEVKEIEGRA